MWILQDLHLSKKAWLCCGPIVEDLANLRALDMLVQFLARERKRFIRRFINDKICIWAASAKKSKFRLIKGMGYLGYLFKNDYKWIVDVPLDGQVKTMNPQRHCLYLACDSGKGRKRLAEVLAKFEGSQCADVRDRLYGSLSLVDWRGTSAPLPEYSKDNFEVATEVMGLIVMQFGEVILSPEDWAQHLFEMFAITAGNTFLCKAVDIRLRRLASLQSLRPNRGEYVYGIWRGREILLHTTSQPKDGSDDKERVKSVLYVSQRGSNQGFVKLVDRRGVLVAHAAPNTQEGDWFLTFHWKGMSLIVRESEAQIYAIVGIAILHEDPLEDYRPKWWKPQFKVHWHAEDILVLHGLSRNTLLSQNELLSIQVCGTENSSYATRYYY